jgi:hypothetical protein
MTETWAITARKIEQHHLPGRYLGRNVYHDSRNLAYPWRHSGAAPASRMWNRHGGILDQLDLGSCVGNAELGAVECDPCFGALPASHPPLNETLAVKIYSVATSLDSFPGSFPPDDTGSDGPDGAKAARQLGLISGYLHCLSLADVLDALQQHPAIVGMNWYEGFDSPDSSGYVSVSGSVRGGHEVLCRGLDVSTQRLYFDNSWGPDWGNNGSFSMSYATLDRLLHEEGDATISLPLTVTPPQPSGPYRHVADGRTTLGQITAARHTTVSHLLGVSAGAYTAADETAARKTTLPAGFPWYTTNP